jgi:hypothetical protein
MHHNRLGYYFYFRRRPLEPPRGLSARLLRQLRQLRLLRLPRCLPRRLMCQRPPLCLLPHLLLPLNPRLLRPLVRLLPRLLPLLPQGGGVSGGQWDNSGCRGERKVIKGQPLIGKQRQTASTRYDKCTGADDAQAQVTYRVPRAASAVGCYPW